MNCKRLGSLAILFAVLTFQASASMVSFLLVETGLNEESNGGQYGSLWEGGLMAIFFDAGHVVTNYPIARMEKKPAKDLSGVIKEDFDEAIQGGADFFIVGFLNYQTQGGTAVPMDIAIKLYKAGSEELVFERNFPAGRGKSLNEEYQFARDAGRTIISQIKGR